MYAKEGIRGFYKGLAASYFGILESSFQFVMYEEMKRYARYKRAEQSNFSIQPDEGIPLLLTV